MRLLRYWNLRPAGSWRRRLLSGALSFALLGGLLITAGIAADDNAGCARRLIAGGDGVVEGKHADNPTTERYSTQLITEHAQPVNDPGPWCELNTGKDATTTDTYVSEGQMGDAWAHGPRLITLTLGRQNKGIVEHITTCLQKIKDHDFLEANTCALQVLLDQGAWDKLSQDLSRILNTYKVQIDGEPELIAVVTGYFNPYPAADDVATKIPEFCAKLQDTIPTCTARWILLPPALITLDQVVQKLNTTISEVVKHFTIASQGHIVFVNPYEKFKDHCTTMKVEIKTKVYHPTNTVHNHDTDKDFGCSDPWIASDESPGNKTPFIYLTPAATGVLIFATQKTEKMGINPNEKGHDCIADLIWEKVKLDLGISEPPQDPCT